LSFRNFTGLLAQTSTSAAKPERSGPLFCTAFCSRVPINNSPRRQASHNSKSEAPDRLHAEPGQKIEKQNGIYFGCAISARKNSEITPLHLWESDRHHAHRSEAAAISDDRLSFSPSLTIFKIG
jgi:hypothetical protein